VTRPATFPEVAADALAWIDAAAMREIDRAMIEDVGVTLLQMMENAGRALADVVMTLDPPRVLVLAGTGGNGGGGLVAARHLSNLGVPVDVHRTGSARAGSAAAHQWGILGSMGIAEINDPASAGAVVIDAMVGYSLAGPLRDRVRRATERALRSAATIVSLDVPTGVDATTGASVDGAIIADITLTLCAPKTGLRASDAVGDLLVTDISVPPSLVERVSGGAAPPFSRGRTLRVGRA